MTFCNALSISDLKSYTTLRVDPVKSDHPLERVFTVDLGAPNPTVIVHIERLSSMMFTSLMWIVSSLFRRTRGTRSMASGGTRLKLLTARSPSNILLVLWNPAFMESERYLLHFIIFRVRVLVTFPSWRDLPCDHISETTHISRNGLYIC